MTAGFVRAAALLLCGGLLVSPASAQETQSVALVAAGAADPADADVAPSIDAAIRRAVEAIDAVDIRGEAALDLTEVQLALGCEAANAECLRTVANELGASRLLIPRISRRADQVVLEIELFDAEAGDSRSAERVAPDASVGQLLDGVDGMVGELFDVLEPVVDPDPPPDDAPPDAVITAPPSSRGPDHSRVGVAAGLSGLGAIAIGLGVGFGVWSEATAADYAAAPLDDDADATAALALLRDAEAQATAANVLLVAGGAVLAAGVVWLIVELASPEDDDTATVRVSPLIGDSVAGLWMGGRLP